MILVTTAGKVGAEAAKLLAERSQPVRTIVRNPASAAGLAGTGVEVVAGDLDRPDTIDAAMRGVSVVILVSPAVPSQELRVIDSAMRAGIAHVVKVTSKSALDSPIARRRGQAEIERALADSGLGFTLLRNNAYMQNFFMMASTIADQDSFAATGGQGRVSHIDARDVAAVAAEIAVAPAMHLASTYWPTGPESLSYTEVADIFTEVLGRKITYRPFSFEQQRQAMIDAGLPEAVADDNARALSLFAEGDADYLNDDVATILGRPARTFQEFVADHAAIFRQPVHLTAT